jgi:hypothetical protein
MVLEAFENLNWLAVIMAGLAYFALGAIWFPISCSESSTGRPSESPNGRAPPWPGHSSSIS